MGTGMVADPDSFRSALEEAVRQAHVAARTATPEINAPS